MVLNLAQISVNVIHNNNKKKTIFYFRLYTIIKAENGLKLVTFMVSSSLIFYVNQFKSVSFVVTQSRKRSILRQFLL